MQAHYDPEVDVLRLTNGEPVAVSEELIDHSVVVELGSEGGHDIIGLIIMGASAYFPFGNTYDQQRDILTFGDPAGDAVTVKDSGEFVGYWQPDEYCPDQVIVPVGVAVKRASQHLADVLPDIERKTQLRTV